MGVRKELVGRPPVGNRCPRDMEAVFVCKTHRRRSVRGMPGIKALNPIQPRVLQCTEDFLQAPVEQPSWQGWARTAFPPASWMAAMHSGRLPPLNALVFVRVQIAVEGLPGREETYPRRSITREAGRATTCRLRGPPPPPAARPAPSRGETRRCGISAPSRLARSLRQSSARAGTLGAQIEAEYACDGPPGPSSTSPRSTVNPQVCPARTASSAPSMVSDR